MGRETMTVFRASTLIATGTVLVTAGVVTVQPTSLEPDLSALVAGRGWTIVNRSARRIDKDGEPAVRLEGGGGIGLARLEDVTFGDGVIEIDLRGKNIPQRSFLGIAFHGGDDTTYDAVYFRPFTFGADDAVRRQRAVQYISHPAHTWHSLREQFPGKYESSVAPVAGPERWFHARIVVAWPNVSVFVNDATEPSLVVDQLSQRKKGWIALWVDVSDGDFANLKVTPRQ
jgi:hypothetical protein